MRRGGAPHRRGRRPHREPVRGVAVGPVPHAAGSRHVLATLTAEGGALGLPSLRAPTGVNSVEYDGRPGVQQLWVLRLLRLPDRGQGRSGRDVAPRCVPAAARSAPRPTSRRGRARRHGKARDGVRCLDADGAAHMVTAGAVVVACGRSRRRACSCAPRSGTHRTSSAASSCSTCRRSCSAVPVPPPRATRAVTSPTSWTTRSSATANRRRRRDGSPLPARRHRRARRERPARSWRRCISAGGRTARSWPTRRCGTRMAAFTMQGEDLPQATNRADLDPAVRDVWGMPPVASRIRRTRTRWRAHPLGAATRSGDARGRRAGHVVGHVATDGPPQRRR